jgi:hypothetical protein
MCPPHTSVSVAAQPLQALAGMPCTRSRTSLPGGGPHIGRCQCGGDNRIVYDALPRPHHLLTCVCRPAPVDRMSVCLGHTVTVPCARGALATNPAPPLIPYVFLGRISLLDGPVRGTATSGALRPNPGCTRSLRAKGCMAISAVATPQGMRSQT